MFRNSNQRTTSPRQPRRLFVRRGGYTLIEVMVAMGVMSVFSTGVMSIMNTAVSCADKTSVEAFTTTDAVLAMQKIVVNVREAKTISVLDGGKRMRVVTPKKFPGGYYNRYEPNLGNQNDYYLSDTSGEIGKSGTYLWKSVTGSGDDPVLLRKNVKELSFVQDTSRSVQISLVAENDAPGGPQQTRLTQRVVFLRNY